MSTSVAVNTYTHSVTYVTDKLLSSMKLIILLSGLSPEKLTTEWAVLERGIKRWLETQDLEELHLEIYDPKNQNLVLLWDFEVSYGYTGDGTFWADPAAIRYHIQKAGVAPQTCNYRIVATTKLGRPEVIGWTSTTLRSTDGFVRQSIGTTIDGSGLSGGAAYWRKI